MNNSPKPTNKIIIPSDIKPYPSDHEISAALLLAKYFNTNVTFIKRSHLHTADFLIKNQPWEHKSPTGNSKRTIQNNLRKADHQSPRVVIDLRHSKISETQAINRIQFILSKTHKIKHLLVITKSNKILALK